MRDMNEIAATILRQAVTHAASVQKARVHDMQAAWRNARAQARNAPQARERIKPRLPLPPMAPDELARIGQVDGLTDR